MPKLTIRAQNICGAASDFWLQGLEQRDTTPNDGGQLVIDLGLARKERWFEVVNIRSDGPVEPGQILTQEAECDYDVRKLVWGVPEQHLRGRFLLLELSWGDHQLLKEPGAV